jgi:hypothetical protein
LFANKTAGPCEADAQGVDALTGGAQFEILIEDKSRSWRDDKAIAIAAGCYMKERNPT